MRSIAPATEVSIQVSSLLISSWRFTL
jgi:hypothetical protein